MLHWLIEKSRSFDDGDADGDADGDGDGDADGDGADGGTNGGGGGGGALPMLRIVIPFRMRYLCSHEILSTNRR